MGLSLSLLGAAWGEIFSYCFHNCVDYIPFDHPKEQMIVRAADRIDQKTQPDVNDISQSNEFVKGTSKNSINFSGCKPVTLILETSLSFKSILLDQEPRIEVDETKTFMSLPEPAIYFSPRPVTELEAAAAVKVQKVYKSYRTRRNLADCAIVVEELWWKALDFAELKQSSVSFYNNEKSGTAISKWARARVKASKVGKGLSKDEKARKLSLQHWLEAIDPRHRYGHNLHLYYDIWFESQSTQPFFYWLDIGDGKEVSVGSCPRSKLQHDCIKYLGPRERESYEVIIVDDGKLMYKHSGILVDTTEVCKWIFVLSTSRNLYVGKKSKGKFQHSSFLAGAATTAAGRLIAHNGILEAIWPYSGHYHPTEENFLEFITFLEEHNVNLTNVKKCSIDEDDPTIVNMGAHDEEETLLAPKIKSDRMSCKWTSGVGARIGCVRDYPVELQSRALEQVNLSPRTEPFASYGPIPSPRPSSKMRLSPRLLYMGLPSPRTLIAMPNC